MKLTASLRRSATQLAQTESGTFWKWLYALLALSCIVAIVTAVLLGLPNRPKTISLAGYESRLIAPNTIAYGFILLSDPEGGVNSFVLSKPPPTYVVPATLEQSFSLPRGHFKYWVRHVNVGSRLKMSVQWSSDTPLQFCLTMASVESYLMNSNECLVKLNSRSRLSFEYVTKHSGDHFFIMENAGLAEPTAPSVNREPLWVGDKTVAQAPSSVVNFMSNNRDNSNINGENVKQDQRLPKALLSLRSSDPIKTSTTGPLISIGTPSPRLSLPQSRNLHSINLQANDEQPEFFMVRGNVSFEMALIQYDTNQADDLFVGTFSKEFEFNHPEWLVLYNPSDSRIFSITISVTRRYKELLIAVFFIEFFLLSTISCCCYCRYSSVPLKIDPETGMRLFSRKNRARHLGDARSRSTDDTEMVGENPWDLPPAISSPESEERRAVRRVALSSGAAIPLFPPR
jgi:hypothetical protein